MFQYLDVEETVIILQHWCCYWLVLRTTVDWRVVPHDRMSVAFILVLFYFISFHIHAVTLPLYVFIKLLSLWFLASLQLSVYM